MFIPEGQSTIVDITTIGQFKKIEGNMNLNLSDGSDRFALSNNGIIQYIGGFPKTFSISCTISAESGNNIDLIFQLAVNGQFLPRSRTMFTTSGAGRVQAVTLQDILPLTFGDEISVHCANNTSTANITITSLNLIIN
jgi:hypothetical protein